MQSRNSWSKKAISSSSSSFWVKVWLYSYTREGSRPVFDSHENQSMAMYVWCVLVMIDDGERECLYGAEAVGVFDLVAFSSFLFFVKLRVVEGDKKEVNGVTHHNEWCNAN